MRRTVPASEYSKQDLDDTIRFTKAVARFTTDSVLKGRCAVVLAYIQMMEALDPHWRLAMVCKIRDTYKDQEVPVRDVLLDTTHDYLKLSLDDLRLNPLRR